ncbi:MAG: hypothetical protein ACOCRO_00885 [Halanaerobiales bacterium]
MLAHSIIAKKLLLGETLCLEDFECQHFLSGVEFDSTDPRSGSDENKANRMTLIIDDIPFGFVEDPTDGYRSSMKCVELSDAVVRNTFNPILLNFTYWDEEHHELLVAHLPNIQEKKLETAVLQVGTDNTDDYYPCYVDYWSPEKLYFFKSND